MPGGNGGLSLRDVRLSTLCVVDGDIDGDIQGDGGGGVIEGNSGEDNGGNGPSGDPMSAGGSILDGLPPLGSSTAHGPSTVRTFTAKELALARRTGREQEDWHFAVCIGRLGGALGSPEQQQAFAAYGDAALPGALGAHKVNLSTPHAAAFVRDACPEYIGVL